MHVAKADGLRALEAYQNACGARPLLERRGHPDTGLCLYHWGIKPVREARVPRIREVTLTIHLGGARRVRIFTENGISRRFSKPGDITLLPHGQSIRWLVDGGADFATVHLPATATALLEEQTGLDLLNLSDCLFAFRDEYALASVRTLMQADVATNHSSDAYSAQVLESLAFHISRIVTRGNAERLRLADNTVAEANFERSIDFEALINEIDTKLGEPISIKDLADFSGFGRSSFCEQFKQHFGATPHRYILDRRIGRAKLFLSSGAQNLTSIAYDLGFSSAAHFSTAFKNATGFSPRLFAQRFRSLQNTRNSARR